MCPCGGHRTMYENRFSLPNVWVPGTELRSSALAASTFTSLAIFPVQIFFHIKPQRFGIQHVPGTWVVCPRRPAVLTLNCQLLNSEKPRLWKDLASRGEQPHWTFESFHLVPSWKTIRPPLSMEVGSCPGVLQTSLTSPIPFSSWPRLGTSFTLRNLFKQAACGKGWKRRHDLLNV